MDPSTSVGSIRSRSTSRSFQRKVLSPNDFSGLEALAERLLGFQYYWEAAAKPFEWKFTRSDLAALLSKYPTPDRVAA